MKRVVPFIDFSYFGEFCNYIYWLASECSSAMVYFPVPITKKFESENWALHHKFSHSHWQLLQLKKVQNPSIPEQAGEERGERRKREDRPHTTSSSVHRVAEATLKSVPQGLTCVTKIRADWGGRSAWRGEKY